MLSKPKLPPSPQQHTPPCLPIEGDIGGGGGTATREEAEEAQPEEEEDDDDDEEEVLGFWGSILWMFFLTVLPPRPAPRPAATSPGAASALRLALGPWPPPLLTPSAPRSI